MKLYELLMKNEITLEEIANLPQLIEDSRLAIELAQTIKRVPVEIGRLSTVLHENDDFTLEVDKNGKGTIYGILCTNIVNYEKDVNLLDPKEVLELLQKEKIREFMHEAIDACIKKFPNKDKEVLTI